MSVHVLKYMRARASQMACNTRLYNWSLRGPAPERMVMRPVDPWPGDAEAGRAVCEGLQCWEPQGAPAVWIAHMHGFVWLRDVKAYAAQKGASIAARAQTRAMIESWINHYADWHPRTWRADLTGQRLAMWLCSYDFFGEEEGISREDEEAFQDLFFDSAMRQARHLSRALDSDRIETECTGPGRFEAARGLLYAGIAFEGQEAWIAQALEFIRHEIDAQIAGDGSHRSRSPSQLLSVLRLLLDVRMVLGAADYPLPEKLQHAIDRMGPALRFFRYSDKGLALFNGTQEGDEDCLDSVLQQAGVRSKTLNGLPCAGFERLIMGRTTIVMDCGPSAPYPYDAQSHAAPLAFEMCYGRERLFVNCGGHPSDVAWQDALRTTAAHTALCLDHRNACEIGKGGHFARRVRRHSHLREDLKNAILVEASHDGYAPLNGYTHRRRLYLTADGHDLRGEEMLHTEILPPRPIAAAVRFHLHPRVLVSLIRDGQEALLRLPGGVGWRFHLQGGVLALENSVYLGQGTEPRKTKQLVIHTILNVRAQVIKWALQKEG